MRRSGVDSDLDALLADVTRERDEYLELAQRARADFENYRKRAAREAQEAERRGKAAVAPRAAAGPGQPGAGSQGIRNRPGRWDRVGPDDEPQSEEVSGREALARGVALVHRRAASRARARRRGDLRSDGGAVRPESSTRRLRCDAGADGVDSGVVVETLEKGYRLDGQVLRAARVVVSE